MFEKMCIEINAEDGKSLLINFELIEGNRYEALIAYGYCGDYDSDFSKKISFSQEESKLVCRALNRANITKLNTLEHRKYKRGLDAHWNIIYSFYGDDESTHIKGVFERWLEAWGHISHCVDMALPYDYLYDFITKEIVLVNFAKHLNGLIDLLANDD